MSLLDFIETPFRGLFGSSARDYAANDDSPTPTTVPAPQPASPPGLSFRDRAALFATALDDPAKALLLRKQLENAPAVAAAKKDIADFAAGRKINPLPPAVPQYQPSLAPVNPVASATQDAVSGLSPDLGTDTTQALPQYRISGPDTSGIVPQRDPMADQFGKSVTAANMLPILISAQARGVDISPYLKAFQVAQPNHQHVEVPNVGLVDYNPAGGTANTLVKTPLIVGTDKRIYMPDDGSGAQPQAAASPASQASPLANASGLSVTMPTDTTGGLNVRGVRNNNPLNVTTLPNGQAWAGQTGTDGQYAVFGTPEQGYEAADKNLQAYYTKHGIDTLQGVITRWAPQAGGNDPQAYVQKVAQTLGVDPSAPLNLADPGVRRQVLTAMSGVELGKPITVADAGQAQPTLTGSAGSDNVAPQIPGYKLVQDVNQGPGYHKATPDELKALGLPETANIIIDPKGKPMEPPGGESGNLEPALQGLTGDQLISKLTPAEGAQVKALAEGRMPFPSSFAISKPYWQRMLQLVSQYDPTFNAADYQSRASTRKDFTSGKSAQNITALNTVIGHLNDLDKSIDGLGNIGPGDSGGIGLGPLNGLNNYLAHKIAQASGHDARITTFNNAKAAVANELTRVFRGTGGAEADIKGWQQQLDDASSPQSLRAVVHSMASLINSRLEALGEQYNQGMGRAQDPLRLLTPDKAAMFARMRDGYGPNDPEAKRYTPQSVGATTAAQGGATAVPKAAASPGRTPNPNAVRFLMSHPETAAQFDAWYGPGSSARYIKGR